MKFAACITLFNPSLKNIDGLKNYEKVFDKVYIYDNSNDNSTYRDKINSNYTYLYNKTNDGLCKAFNIVLEDCIKNKFDFLCTMDQDSIFKELEIKKIIDYINNKTSNIKDVAIFAPRIVYQTANVVNEYENTIDNTDWVICSGSFFNLNIIEKENIRYDEYYFLDRFDRDICKQITNKGYKIVVLNNSHLYQQIGYTRKGKSNHSSIRHYYIFRNRFYYNKKFYPPIIRHIRTFLQTTKHIVMIIRKEDKKKLKIKQFFIAYTDYRNGNGGIK